MTIAEEWQRFEAMVLPRHASDVQRSEMRKAFYAGATSSIATIITDASVSLSEDDAMIVLGGLARECGEFGNEMLASALHMMRKQSASQTLPEWLDEPAVSLILDVKASTLRSWRKRRRFLPFEKAGRKVRYATSAVLEFLDRSRVDCH